MDSLNPSYRGIKPEPLLLLCDATIKRNHLLNHLLNINLVCIINCVVRQGKNSVWLVWFCSCQMLINQFQYTNLEEKNYIDATNF